jgi:hypothetical protein
METILIRIRLDLGSKISPQTDYPHETFHGFPKSPS